MKHKSRYIFLLIFSLLLSGCSLAPKEEVLPDAPVLPAAAIKGYQKAEVIRGDMIESLKTRCAYNAIYTKEYKFSVNGIRIDHIYVAEGDTVKEGELLADLDMNQINQQIEELTDHIELLELKDKNERELKTYAITLQNKLRSLEGYTMQMDSEYEQEMQNYDNAIKALEDELYIAQKRLELLVRERSGRQIIADINGVVSYVSSYREWEVSDDSAVFIRVYDPNTMLFVTDGTNSERFSPGQEVTINVSGIEYKAAVVPPGELLREEEIKLEQGKLLLRAEDPERNLQSGDEGIITFILNEITDTLFLPSSAVHMENGKAFVYVEDEGGFKSLKEIETGLIADKKTEIKSGLIEGDSVIIN
ncbi:macrolide-specific efflux system membrane fusion protein [Anaerotaenia torta]|uniref:efflux RND transporter periplasmic adaptor subunit n=1 Tax=Anaerotaenia torta TaxID=433293 RepID=UPI003D25BABF